MSRVNGPTEDIAPRVVRENDRVNKLIYIDFRRHRHAGVTRGLHPYVDGGRIQAPRGTQLLPIDFTGIPVHFIHSALSSNRSARNKSDADLTTLAVEKARQSSA